MAETARHRYRFGIDIGGTFTDLVLIDESAGTIQIGKTLTTPDDPAVGVLTGFRGLLAEHGISADAVAGAVHATTLVTNAIIERKGSRVGLLTTDGFRDVLGVGRELRYDLYDLFIEMPEPLVARHLRFQVPERVDRFGEVAVPLDTQVLEESVAALKAAGCDSVAIAFIHSYANDAHERAAADLVRAMLPGVAISRSANVSRELREYERFSTTVADAYVKPLVRTYLGTLEDMMKEAGFDGSLHIMLSNGGIASTLAAKERPIGLVESGPAAGALGAGFFGQLAGLDRVLAFDMGGTTAKACVVDDGEPMTTYDFEAARVKRFRRGSGLPLKVAAVDLVEIGAGGGSIARVDELGLLKVGPESSGSEPGPACYGRGGTSATVTDADLVLGYLDPDFFLGGRMALDAQAAGQAHEALGRDLGVSRTEAAWGVHNLVNENMASAARVHFAELGRDARQYTLVATGGAGPVHAYRVAQKLEIRRLVCPLGAGVASTVGMLVAPPRADLAHAYVTRLADVDLGRLEAIYSDMEASASETLTSAGVATGDITFRRTADIRYVGQGYEVVTAIPEGSSNGGFHAAVQSSFESTYERLYERTLGDTDTEVLNWRLTAFGPSFGRDRVATALGLRSTEGIDAADRGVRMAYMPEARDYVPTQIYDRYALPSGTTFDGPAIIEERESTVVVGPGSQFWLDDVQNLIVEVAR